jgi:hypothetical protein
VEEEVIVLLEDLEIDEAGHNNNFRENDNHSVQNLEQGIDKNC